jgi:hypothetical protein
MRSNGVGNLSVKLPHELKMPSLDLLLFLNCVPALLAKVLNSELVFVIFHLRLSVAPFTF